MATKRNGASGKGFTPQEREAMKERAKELRTKAGTGEEEAREAIGKMPPEDRAMAERIHAIVKANAPELKARTWYRMPAWAQDDRVICFFQSGQKFKTRYATLGFSDKAKLDEGTMWATAFALKELTSENEARIGALVKKAAKEK